MHQSQIPPRAILLQKSLMHNAICGMGLFGGPCLQNDFTGNWTFIGDGYNGFADIIVVRGVVNRTVYPISCAHGLLWLVLKMVISSFNFVIYLLLSFKVDSSTGGVGGGNTW